MCRVAKGSLLNRRSKVRIKGSPRQDGQGCLGRPVALLDRGLARAKHHASRHYEPYETSIQYKAPLLTLSRNVIGWWGSCHLCPELASACLSRSVKWCAFTRYPAEVQTPPLVFCAVTLWPFAEALHTSQLVTPPFPKGCDVR